MPQKKNPATVSPKRKSKKAPVTAAVKRAVARIRTKAARSGLADMDLDELDRQIAEVRAARKARAKKKRA